MDGLERIIIADPESNVYDFAKKVYEKIIEIEKEREGKNENDSEFKFKDIDRKRFDDDEFEPQIVPNSRLRNIIYFADSTQNPSEWVIEIALVNDAAKRGDASKITNVLPYMRWSRAEKKDKPHIGIASRVVADIIGKEANRTITSDLHAEAIQGFFQKIDNLECYLPISEYFKKNYPDFIKENLVLVSPDHGASDRTRLLRDAINPNLGMVIIDKKRISGTKTKIYGVIGNVKGKNCLMFDDILSSGGTLKEGANALRDVGAKLVYGGATHFVGVKDYLENIKALDKVFVTDTFYKETPNIPNLEIISVVDLFAEAIYRGEKGESISELYLKKR